MHPKTDIIVLTHNQLSITKGFVDHLFENTKNFRLLFIDNGSTDGTYEFLLKGNAYWDVIRSETNLGIIKGRNLGAEHIQNEYFMNIDNDQYPTDSSWLDGLHDLLLNHDVVGCEAWMLYPPYTPGKIMIGKNEFDRSYYPFKRCTKNGEKFTYIGCGGMLIKKNVYDKIKLFDERFGSAYFEDPDFSFRCIQNGFKLGWKSDCPIKHLEHQTINNQKLFLKNEQFLKSWQTFRKKWLPYFPE